MTRSARLSATLVALVVLVSKGAFAQDTELRVSSGDFPRDEIGTGEGFQGRSVRRSLSVDDAVAFALANDLQVEVERFEPLIAASDAAGAWGAYDPRLNADYTYDVRKSPNTFSLNAAAFNIDRENSGGVGIEQLIPYLGARFGIRFDGSKTTTSSTLQALDPQYDSSVFLTARVPLARGLIWNEPWTQVKVRASQYRASRESFQSAVMDTTQSTVDRYWELVAAFEQVGVARKSLETARALAEQVDTQYEVGVVSRVEVVEATAGVAEREFDVIVAENRYRNVQDRLIDRVFGTELSAGSELRIVPTEDAQAYRIRTVDVEDAVAVAFRERPELKVLEREIDQGELDLRFARNQRLPQFDVDVRWGFVGITGEGNPDLTFGTPTDRGDFGESTDDFFSGDGADNLRVTGTFSIPFPNTTARKRVTRSKLELRRTQTRRVRLEQDIIIGVREAARNLRASEQGIRAAERRRLAAEEQLRAERIRLEHGESTPFDVLQRESDLVEAESQKIEALRSYREGETALERAQGTILDFYKVRIEDAWKPAS